MKFGKKLIVLLVMMSILTISLSALAQEQGDNKIGLAVGMKMDMAMTGKYRVPGPNVDAEFGVGFGITAEYTLPFFKYVHVGFDFMGYTVKADGANDRDGIIAFGPRLVGAYSFNDIGPFKAIVPYVYLVMGPSFYIVNNGPGDNQTGFYIQGGVGGELIFRFMNGSLGAFLEMGGMGNIYDDDIKFTTDAFCMNIGARFHL